METTGPVNVERVASLPVPELLLLVEESEAEGHGFLRRLVAEWSSGQNRFAGPGEALYVARQGARLVGVCGLNADPYARVPGIGRLRHLYVAADYRRRGVGQTLVGRVIRDAAGSYQTLTLRTDSPAAAAFYAALAFVAGCTLPSSTHSLELNSPPPVKLGPLL